MLTEIGAAVSGFKTVMDITKGISALKTENEKNQAIFDIQRMLLDLQAAALDDKQTISQLRDQITKLQSEIEKKQNWADEKKRYLLTKSQRGVYFYSLKPDIENAEIDHRLCATCFENDKKSILHTIASERGGEYVKCLICDEVLQLTDKEPLPRIEYPSRGVL